MNLNENSQHRRARVLFVSWSNACRDQMAEAFSRALGEDSMLAFSAGVNPAYAVSGAARTVMEERGVPLFLDQKPKRLADLDLSSFDVIVNLSGCRLPANTAQVLAPVVPSPLANDLDTHRAARDRMETFVRFLIDHFRRAKAQSPNLPLEPITMGAIARPGRHAMPAQQPATAP